jgi:hypothetical protein
MPVAGSVPDAVPIDRGDGVYEIRAVTDPLYNPADPSLGFVSVRGAIQTF